jgi:hypothetical protein
MTHLWMHGQALNQPTQTSRPWFIFKVVCKKAPWNMDFGKGLMNCSEGRSGERPTGHSESCPEPAQIVKSIVVRSQFTRRDDHGTSIDIGASEANRS